MMKMKSTSPGLDKLAELLGSLKGGSHKKLLKTKKTNSKKLVFGKEK